MSEGRVPATLNYPRAALVLATQRWENFHAKQPTTSSLDSRTYLGAVTCSDAPDQRHNVLLAYVASDGAVRSIGGGYVVDEQPSACGGRVVFNAVQHRNKLIGVYSRVGDEAPVDSARSFLRFPAPSPSTEIWVDDLRITGLPVLFGDAMALYFSEGVYVAVLPLVGASACGALVVLREEHHGLTFTLYDRVPDSDEEWGPQLTGYIVEVASAEEFAALEDFRQHIEKAELEDFLEGAVRTVTYASGGDVLTLSVETGQERDAKWTVGSLVNSDAPTDGGAAPTSKLELPR